MDLVADFVVIGGGVAGVTCATALAGCAPGARVVLLCPGTGAPGSGQGPRLQRVATARRIGRYAEALELVDAGLSSGCGPPAAARLSNGDVVGGGGGDCHRRYSDGGQCGRDGAAPAHPPNLLVGRAQQEQTGCGLSYSYRARRGETMHAAASKRISCGFHLSTRGALRWSKAPRPRSTRRAACSCLPTAACCVTAARAASAPAHRRGWRRWRKAIRRWSD